MLSGLTFDVSFHMLTSDNWPQNFIRMFTSGIVTVNLLHLFIFIFLSVPRQLLSENPHLFTSAFILTAARVVLAISVACL